MDAADIAFTASRLSREKIDAEGRRGSVMIENDLEPDLCAHALAAAIQALNVERERCANLAMAWVGVCAKKLDEREITRHEYQINMAAANVIARKIREVAND